LLDLRLPPASAGFLLSWLFDTEDERATCSSETSGCLLATRDYNPEDRILHIIGLVIRKENYHQLFLLFEVSSFFATSLCSVAMLSPSQFAVY
jgi:hypothetical protein